MTVPLRDKLATLLHEAYRTSDAWMDDKNWTKVADALLASEEWQAREAVVEALAPFASGGDWGTWKAYMVHGPETKERGIEAAKQITAWQVVVDAALARLDAGKEEKVSQGWHRDYVERVDE